MTEIIFKAMELGVMIAVLAYLHILRKMHENEHASEIIDNIQLWADIVVRWAADRLSGESGESRRNAAINALKEIRDKLGIDITDEQVAMIVSSAYRMMVEDTIELDGIELIDNLEFEI